MRSRSLHRACILCVHGFARPHRLLSTTNPRDSQQAAPAASDLNRHDSGNAEYSPRRQPAAGLARLQRSQHQPFVETHRSQLPVAESQQGLFNLSRVGTGPAHTFVRNEPIPEWDPTTSPTKKQYQKPRCTACGRFGHDETTCTLSQRQDDNRKPHTPPKLRIRYAVSNRGNIEDNIASRWNFENRQPNREPLDRRKVAMMGTSKPRIESEVVRLFGSEEERKTWAASRPQTDLAPVRVEDAESAEDESLARSDDFQSSVTRPLTKRVSEPSNGMTSRLRDRLSQIEHRQSERDRNTVKQALKKKSRNSRYDEDSAESGGVWQSHAVRPQKPAIAKQKKAATKKAPRIRLPTHISVSNLAVILRHRLKPFTQRLVRLGFQELAHNHILTAEDAALIAMEFGFQPVIESASQDLVAAPWPTDLSEVALRPPVVTIMGHVDHGKTTILDYLRKSSIVAQEAGGITQHIGAFSVALEATGRTITFLDTPGHAAFLSMRERGANVTDIVVLVVAADDGVKPQTIEAIKHAKAARVPMIVAINKVDKVDPKDLDRVKQGVARQGVEIEDYGGDTQVVCISGKTGQGIDTLEDAILTLSEILDHRAPPDGNVEGWVLESSTTEELGRIATVLVRRGTLRVGDVIVAGQSWAKVRTLRNEFGQLVDSVEPGSPASVDGWRSTPNPGDEALQASDEQQAASVVRTREDLAAQVKLAADMQAVNELRKEQSRIREEETHGLTKKEVRIRQHRLGLIEGTLLDVSSLSESNASAAAGDEDDKVFTLNFVVKADVIGSAEAVVNLISGLGTQRVRVQIVRTSTGALSKTDIDMAIVAKATILAFNADVPSDVRQLAHEQNVEILEHDVIYRLPEAVTQKMRAKLPKRMVQRVTGEAEILATFEIKEKAGGAKVKKLVAGCKVRNGMIKKGSKIRVMRDGEVVYDGALESLRNEKKDVTEIKKDSECGMGFDGWQAFAVGDKIQTYSESAEDREL